MTSRRRTRAGRFAPPTPAPPTEEIIEIPPVVEPALEAPAPEIAVVAEPFSTSEADLTLSPAPESAPEPGLVAKIAETLFTPEYISALITSVTETLLELVPLANTGYCQNGHMVWSGGPPSEGEFPLTCRFCEVKVERPQ